MAWNDLIVKVGMDASGYTTGVQKVKRDGQGLRQGLAQLSRTLTDQREHLRKLGQQGKGASNEYKALKKEISENNAQFRSMTRELRAVESAQGKTVNKTNEMQRAFRGMGGAITGGLIGGGVAGAAIMGVNALKTGFNEALTVAISFDDAMRKVRATSGATAAEFDKLRATAIAMSSSTRFTASEAADALNFMALAGWNVQQQISGLPGLLDLAAASTTDLSRASDILTDTMAAFGMKASQSSEVADVFAQAQSKANTSVEQLGEALAKSAPVANAANQSLQSTVTILSLLADSGIKASVAGTVYDGILRDLRKSANDGVVQFGKYNVSLYDAEGNFRDLVQIMHEMRTAMAGLTTQQRDAIIGGIFDVRSKKGIDVILDSTEEKINNLSDAMENATGRAHEMAKMMEGGVGGAQRAMKSQWEALQLTIAQDAGLANTWYGFWSDKFLKFRMQLHEVGDLWNKTTNLFKKSTNELATELPTLKVQVDPVVEEAVKGNINLEENIGEPSKKVKTASSVFRDFQKELKATGEYFRFIGDEANFSTESIKLVEGAMRQVFMMGGKEAEKYAAKLKEQLNSLIAETRGPQIDVQPLPSLMSAVKFELQIPTKAAEDFKKATKIKQELAEELRLVGLEAVAFGYQYDELGNKISAVSSSIREALEQGFDIDSEVVRGLIDQLQQLRYLRDEQYLQEEKSLEQQWMKMAAVRDLADVSAQAFSEIGSGALDASAGMAQLGRASVASALESARAAMVAAAAEQLRANSKFGLVGIGLATAAISGIFGLLKGAVSQSKSVSLAKGGIASGRTLAEVGEYSGATFNPEVIAPLDKLKAMLDTSVNVSGDFRIKGDELVLVLNNANRKMGAFRV